MISKYLNKDYQKEYWAKNTNSRDINHPVVVTFMKQRFDYIKSKVDFSKINSAFDVGCGDGFATNYLSKIVKNVHGGDVSELMLKNNPLPNNKKHVIDAENMITIKDNRFDLVMMWEVLHHLKKPENSVKELARITNDWVVIFEPNRANILQFIFGLLTPQERGTLRSSKNYIKILCNNANLEIVDIGYYGKIPPNKTPEFLLSIVKKLPFKSTFVTGISIGVIARKIK